MESIGLNTDTISICQNKSPPKRIWRPYDRQPQTNGRNSKTFCVKCGMHCLQILLQFTVYLSYLKSLRSLCVRELFSKLLINRIKYPEHTAQCNSSPHYKTYKDQCKLSLFLRTVWVVNKSNRNSTTELHLISGVLDRNLTPQISATSAWALTTDQVLENNPNYSLVVLFTC